MALIVKMDGASVTLHGLVNSATGASAMRKSMLVSIDLDGRIVLFISWAVQDDTTFRLWQLQY